MDEDESENCLNKISKQEKKDRILFNYLNKILDMVL